MTGPIPKTITNAIVSDIVSAPIHVTTLELASRHNLEPYIIQNIRTGRTHKSIASHLPRHTAAELKAAWLNRNGTDETTIRRILAHPPAKLSSEIADDENMDTRTITAIRTGRRRSSIAPEIPRYTTKELQQARLDSFGTPEATVRAILLAPADVSCSELARRHGLAISSSATDIRTGRTRASICPDLPRISLATLMRTCRECRLFEASPRRFDTEDGVDTSRAGYCSIGIPECLESPTFARSCSAFVA
jgi:hypothetical protein